MIKGLREAQLELNKRRAMMLEAEYGNEHHMRMQRQKELEDAYNDAYLRWNDYYSGISGDSMALQQGLGTSPVRDYCWKMPASHYVESPEIKMHFDNKLLEKPAPTMVFRRYDHLGSYDELVDLLSRSFLGLLEPAGYKFAQGNAICNEAWTVNLRQQTENRMMGIDIGEELKDLLKVYTDADAHLGRKEKQALDNLVNYMKCFIEVHEERKKVFYKLANLKQKIDMGSKCEDCDGEDEGDDDE